MENTQIFICQSLKVIFVTKGDDITITQININGYTSYKYLVIKEPSQNVMVSYCNFENRINTPDKNILSILVDKKEPGNHIVQHCTFKNIKGAGEGGDYGVEPIRIGVSKQAEFISNSVVEYCYFTQCNGDGEIISHKSRQNIYRYNTFIDNPYSELTLRHGDEGIVYGNYFINGKGGIRVREGKNHIIFNNYFSGQSQRSIFLQSGVAASLVKNVTIAHNTVVNGGVVRLGKSKASGTKLYNNIFFNNEAKKIFKNPSGDEVWRGNMAYGKNIRVQQLILLTLKLHFLLFLTLVTIIALY